jgi:tRNA-dihydrouridine synthase B
MLAWFNKMRPLYLAPMAGVTDSVFRRLCKEQGADVLVTEFVSADGILHRNQRTREMLSFQAEERPLGVQLFGADPQRMAEAAKSVIDWVQPDFIDPEFWLPCQRWSANMVDPLLRDCPLLERVASAVVRPLPLCPSRPRSGWDGVPETINATTTATILEQTGIAAVAVHGRTKEQGYSGVADWEAIAQVAETVSIPVVGNGDLVDVDEIILRLQSTKVRGLMIGRAAMTSPWIFRRAKHFLQTGEFLADPSIEERWSHILRHCLMAMAETDSERHGMAAMRGRLMAYSKGMPGGRSLRAELQQVSSVSQLEAISKHHLAWAREVSASVSVS